LALGACRAALSFPHPCCLIRKCYPKSRRKNQRFFSLGTIFPKFLQRHWPERRIVLQRDQSTDSGANTDRRTRRSPYFPLIDLALSRKIQLDKLCQLRGIISVHPEETSVATKLHRNTPCIELPPCETKSTSKKPGSSSFQSAKVRIGISRLGFVLDLRFFRRLA
jgi:hypothetical protein